VIIRSFEDHKEVTIFSEHKAKVNIARFSATGLWVASGDSEGNVIVWEVGNLKVKNRVQVNSSVLDIAWDPEGKRICAVGEGTSAKARVFTWDSANSLGDITGHSGSILSCDYRQVRPFRVITSSEDLLCNSYEGPPFKFASSFRGHERYPNVVRYDPAGDRFASCGSDSKIFVFDGKTGDKIKELDSKDGHKAAIYSFSWSPDGKSILTAGADKTAKIWDVESGAVTTTFKIAAKTTVADMQMNTVWHNEHLLTVSLSGAMNWHDTKAPDHPKLVFEGTTDNIKSFGIDRANHRLYCGDTTGNLTQWDLKTGLGYWFTGKGHEGKNLAALGVSHDGKVIVTAGYDDRLRIQGPDRKWGSAAVALGGQPVALAVSPIDSGLIAVILTQEKLVIVKNGNVASEQDLKYRGTCIDFTADGKKLIIGAKNKKATVYDFNGTKATPTSVVMECEREINAVHGSPDGKHFVTVDQSRNITFWDQKGTSLNIGWNHHSSTIESTAFSPSGRRFATGSADETIFVWSDFTQWNPMRLRIQAHPQGVAHLAWLDEHTLVSVGDDRIIKVWTVPDS
jgi:WD40 repeat protein